MSPLTHHEIMGLAAPFARSGRHVDLAASDRMKRRLAFKPVDHAAEPANAQGLPARRETPLLENPSSGWFCLVRTLSLPCGL